jgi:hypothetical protein
MRAEELVVRYRSRLLSVIIRKTVALLPIMLQGRVLRQRTFASVYYFPRPNSQKGAKIEPMLHLRGPSENMSDRHRQLPI